MHDHTFDAADRLAGDYRCPNLFKAGPLLKTQSGGIQHKQPFRPIQEVFFLHSGNVLAEGFAQLVVDLAAGNKETFVYYLGIKCLIVFCPFVFYLDTERPADDAAGAGNAESVAFQFLF